MDDLSLGPLDGVRFPEVLDLLRERGLPEAGLANHQPDIIVAVAGTDLVGCVAVECYGMAGLFRSLAVAEAHGGRGIGSRLTEAAMTHAGSRGVAELYLLTETAESFFAARGFEPVARDVAPAEIRGTVEFTEACPASAVCMRKATGEIG